MFAYSISDPKMDISPFNERGVVISHCKFEEALNAISIQIFDFVCAKRGLRFIAYDQRLFGARNDGLPCSRLLL